MDANAVFASTVIGKAILRPAWRERSSGLPAFPFHEYRLTPNYPAKSPLDDILRLIDPGSDEYVTEKQAFEIKQVLDEWANGLRVRPAALELLGKFIDGAIEATPLSQPQEKIIRSKYGIEVIRRQFVGKSTAGRGRFLEEMKAYFAEFASVETAELEITRITPVESSASLFELDVRYKFVGPGKKSSREEHGGFWQMHWWHDEAKGWQAKKWETREEMVSRAQGPVFLDVTEQALGRTDSYQNQLRHGVDYWRTIVDGACGIDVYGNNGIAAGDFDNDGFDDFYVCQPPGLPNRLYRNRGDGTFEDVTEKAGVGVLDGTACALFADFENRGLQDLLVVCGGGPLLFRNQGNGTFQLRQDAFKFKQPPQGTFTHAAVADYDRDGRLDIYFCLYSYYLGLDQYHYPAPYFDARNGPPNFLFQNLGNGVFEDRTEVAGLNVDNDRYSFACSWGDIDGDGWPDLYVVNDFGRNNLYKNKGDGTFEAVSGEAQVEEAGAGMSACWMDFDNDGKQDIYAAGMWVAAGMRVFGEGHFHEKDPEVIRGLYRRHMMGNSLYRNDGKGKFQNVAGRAGVEMGGWSWSTDGWDFDHDGYTDLYVANGYLTGWDERDVSSFFWRQVVAKSPQSSTPSEGYERGWNAINELIRSDGTWNGHERNVLFANNQDGTFSSIGGSVGLDFIEDSRAFALADVDNDGRLEVLLKNRNAPQIRILRNAMKECGKSIAFRLKGTKSNRDAIGTSVVLETDGKTQTKYLQAGSGFLSQHSKELFFGVGNAEGPVRATIRWPSGQTQKFEQLPVNYRIEIEEGREQFGTAPFGASPAAYARAGQSAGAEALPTTAETWLIDPLRAPDFSLKNHEGENYELKSFRGNYLLLTFCATASVASEKQLRALQKQQESLAAAGLKIACVNIDDPQDDRSMQTFVTKGRMAFPVLLATREMAGIYNIIYRHMFDRRRDLGVPTSLLINKDGLIVKIYQGEVSAERIAEDLKSVPQTTAERMRKGLPFAGTLYAGEFTRNDFTYGVALLQHGYLEPAASSFEQVIEAKPDDPEAYYNLGTLYLRQNKLEKARERLGQAVQLRPNHAEAWNNLGMISAQEGHGEEAAHDFQESLRARPTYVTALLNLGGLYRRNGNLGEAEKYLTQALQLEPHNPEGNYALGMLYARQEQLPRAEEYLQKAVELRPGYADALNNLGVLLVREKQFEAAREKFTTCIEKEPNFDQAYLNLARLYVMLEEKEKARQVLRALLEKQPQHKMAQQALEMLH